MKTVFDYRFSALRNGIEKDILFVFSMPPLLDLDVLLDTIDKDIDVNLMPEQLVLSIPEKQFENTVHEFDIGSVCKIIKGRLKKTEGIFLLAYSPSGKIVDVKEVLTGSSKKPFLSFEEIQRRAITHIFKSRCGFIESNANFHFQNPSGRHTEKFVRLSNVLIHPAEISFLAFGALKFLSRDVKYAYIDTPALYGFIGAINEHLRFDDQRTVLIADNFRSYDGFLKHQFENIFESIVFISASTSGKMADQLMSSQGIKKERIVHILYLGEHSSNYSVVGNLCHSSKENPHGYKNIRSYNSSSDCELCKEGSLAIPLKGDQFDIAGPQLESLLIQKTSMSAAFSDTLGNLVGNGLFSVGLNERGLNQPCLYHIDTNKLLESVNFRDKLDLLIRKVVPYKISAVLSLDDDSMELAKAVSNRFETSVNVLKGDDFDILDSNEQDPVIIAASVLESGRSLLEVSRDLRKHCPKTPIIYIVGFSKTTQEATREKLSRTLAQTELSFSHGYFHIEQITLPPSTSESSWKSELSLLRNPEFLKLLKNIPSVLTAVSSRIDLLTDKAVPLKDNLFLRNNSDAKLSLTEGFVFWNNPKFESVTEADVFFTISSVLQTLRIASETNSTKQRISSNWFQQTLLSPSNFGRFNDSMIQASLLRAARPVELNFWERESESYEMYRIIKRVLQSVDKDRGLAAAEFLLALATRRLRLMPKHASSVLDINLANDSLPFCLLEWCRISKLSD